MLLPIIPRNESLALVKSEPVSIASAKILQIEALSKDSQKRPAAENFIQKGYAKTYNAKIHVTTPYLIALEKGALKSALGIRSAKQPLFTEQYLDNSIEQTLSQYGHFLNRTQIAEIAHLYSNAKVFTVPLMLVTAIALKYKGFSAMVFTGTEHVLNLITKTGIDVHKLANASADKLKNGSDNWGTYYETQPEVAFIELNNVLSVIQSTPAFYTMFEELSSQVADVVSNLEDL